MKKALITGITGQDGSYLAEVLLEKGYEVYGLIRRKSFEGFNNLQHLLDKIKFVSGDLTDPASLDEIVSSIRPDEVYNLAAQSFVGSSWGQPVLTTQINALGTLYLLESIRKFAPEARFYHASSSEMFGKALEVPQKESTPFYPRSPYGVSKVYAHYITLNYRESYNLFACSGICFNHESPRRGLEFVTRKITYTLARILAGKEDVLKLGNLEARRDWGYALDYVKMMHLMLQQNEPDDYVISTGETHSVKEFVETALNHLGIEVEWEGEAVGTKGRIKAIKNSKVTNLKIDEIIVELEPKFYRPAEVDLLVGDSAKAKTKLGWQPKVKFQQLVKIMMDSDLRNLGVVIN
ncbi:MAG: GDP-mannose 4,6-dehydratase [Elusimicrobiota bacterium]